MRTTSDIQALRYSQAKHKVEMPDTAQGEATLYSRLASSWCRWQKWQRFSSRRRGASTACAISQQAIRSSVSMPCNGAGDPFPSREPEGGFELRFKTWLKKEKVICRLNVLNQMLKIVQLLNFEYQHDETSRKCHT